MRKKQSLSIVIPLLMSALVAHAQSPTPIPKPVTASDVKSKVAPLQIYAGAGLEELTYQASESLLDIPYRGGTTGEGEKGKFDQDPIVTFDGFDCTTYIESSLSMAMTAESTQSKKEKKVYRDFMNHATEIKYCQKGEPCYENRNHFPELD